MANPSTPMAAAQNCADPCTNGTFAGPETSKINDWFGANVRSTHASVTGLCEDCCGNVNDNGSRFPSLPYTTVEVSIEVEPVFTSVNMVLQPPSAARCGMKLKGPGALPLIRQQTGAGPLSWWIVNGWPPKLSVTLSGAALEFGPTK